MRKFYKIPDSILVKEYTNIIVWLEELPKTKRGKAPFMFGNVMPGSISFTWEKDATAFVIRFGAKLVTEDDRRKYRLVRG